MLFRFSGGTDGEIRVTILQLGHESCPAYYNEYVERIIHNAVFYVAPSEPFYLVMSDVPHWTWKAMEQEWK